MVITRKLNAMKERSGLTQQQISDRSGVPLGTVSRVFAGYAGQAGFNTVADIVHAMNCHVSDIVEEPPSMQHGGETQYPRSVQFYQPLLDEKNIRIRNLRRFLWMLFILLMVTIAVFVAIVVWYSMNPHEIY